MTSMIERAFKYFVDCIPVNGQRHSSLIGFTSALGYHNLEKGVCFGVQRMGTQAVCSREMDVFNRRVERIYDLGIKNVGSYTRVISDLRNELSEGIIKKDASQIESAVDLLAFGEGIAVVQDPQSFRCLLDEEKMRSPEDVKSKLYALCYSQKIESLGGLESVGIAIDKHSAETFKEYISEIKTIAERASIEFLILELVAEAHAMTIIYSPNEHCWYCIDANDLPIKKELSDQEVSNWVFRGYNSLYSTNKKSLLISSNLKVLGKDLEHSKAFENWRAIQQANRLPNLTAEEMNIRNQSNGLTPLQEVAKLERFPGFNCAPIVSSLLDRGADPNLVDKHGNTPLLDFVLRNNIEATKVLLERGANPNIKNKTEEAPLPVAAINGDTEIVQALLKAGADVNVTMQGWTPLMIAAKYGDGKMVLALLRAGAFPFSKTIAKVSQAVKVIFSRISVFIAAPFKLTAKIVRSGFMSFANLFRKK